MKLLSFDTTTGPSVGVETDEGVVDLTRALRLTHPTVSCSGSLLEIIQSGVDIDTVGQDSLERLRHEGRIADFVVANPTYLPPVLRPSKILALAMNFQEHIDETILKMKFYGEPVVFTKYTSNMIGHEAEIELPPFPQRIDEEHELALVVSRDCRHVRPSQAAPYIFGYTICNDVSARDRQRQRSEMMQPYDYAKNFATFCPIGPVVVTAKELPDARDLKMEVRVNGAVTRTGTTARMIFDPFEILAYCSDITPLYAGDVISLGTFSGNKQIREGDVVELEIERIGVLRNRVVASKAPWRTFPTDTPIGPLLRET